MSVKQGRHKIIFLDHIVGCSENHNRVEGWSTSVVLLLCLLLSRTEHDLCPGLTATLVVKSKSVGGYLRGQHVV